jgi:hypothetical protein
MKQLIIKCNDIYEVDGIKFFKYTIANCIIRDIYCNLEKNQKYLLEQIARFCDLKFDKISKSELVELILNSNCLVLEK